MKFIIFLCTAFASLIVFYVIFMMCTIACTIVTVFLLGIKNKMVLDTQFWACVAISVYPTFQLMKPYFEDFIPQSNKKPPPNPAPVQTEGQETQDGKSGS